jgi:hypothetical protein
MQDNNQNNLPQKSNSNTTKILVVAVLLIFAVIIGATLIVVTGSNKSTSTTSKTENSENQTQLPSASIALEPPQATTRAGELVTLSIYVDTGGNLVNAVKADIKYPTDKYEFIKIDDSESDFSVEAVGKEKDGLIIIERGEKNINGKKLLAKIVLKQKTNNGNAEIIFTDDSQIITSDTFKNILGEKSGAKLTLEK